MTSFSGSAHVYIPIQPITGFITVIVKPVLSGHSKIDKTKVIKTNGSLMKSKVLQNALRVHFAILLTCIKR